MKNTIRASISMGLSVLLVAGSFLPVRAVTAETGQTHHIVIAELSAGAMDGATKEYIRIHNNGATAIEVTGWLLQYRSARYTANDESGWSTRAIIGCDTPKVQDCQTPDTVTMKSHQTLEFSTFVAADTLPLASGMAMVGGVMRLVSPSSDDVIVHDKVGYGTAADFEGSAPAPAPESGRAIVRHASKQSYKDTNDNAADFALAEKDEDTSEPGGQGPSPDGDPESPSGPEVPIPDTVEVYKLEITEVMPDPESPSTDSDDEFIELYNPYNKSIDLDGYVIMTGKEWTRKYVLKDIEIAPQSYLALSSAQTNIALSNAGTGVRLYNPDGVLLFEAVDYGKASAGHSWIRDANGNWIWTTKVTPDAANIIDIPLPPPSKPASTTAPKKTSKSTASSAGKTTPSKTSTAVKGAATTAAVASPGGHSSADTSNPLGLIVLAIAVVLGVGYALFEYRHEIGGFIRRRWEAMRAGKKE